MAVTCAKPRGFPLIEFVREIVLGIRTPISPVPRPAKGLIEVLSLDFHRARGQDKSSPEFCEPDDHGVTDSQCCSPHGGISSPGHEHVPVIEGHLEQPNLGVERYHSAHHHMVSPKHGPMIVLGCGVLLAKTCNTRVKTAPPVHLCASRAREDSGLIRSLNKPSINPLYVPGKASGDPINIPVLSSFQESCEDGVGYPYVSPCAGKA